MPSLARIRSWWKLKRRGPILQCRFKKCIARHRQSACATDEGKVKLELKPLDVKPAGTLGESLPSGVVTEVDPQDGSEFSRLCLK